MQGVKPIGMKLQIEDGLVLKRKGVERKLAIGLPSSCITVKDVKKYLVKKLFHNDQEIKLFLGDTMRELPDFSLANVFEVFKGSVIRIVPAQYSGGLQANGTCAVISPTNEETGTIVLEKSRMSPKTVGSHKPSRSKKSPKFPSLVFNSSETVTSASFPGEITNNSETITPQPSTSKSKCSFPNLNSEKAGEDNHEQSSASSTPKLKLSASAKRRARHVRSILRRNATEKLSVKPLTQEASEFGNTTSIVHALDTRMDLSNGKSVFAQPTSVQEDEVDLTSTPARRSKKRYFEEVASTSASAPVDNLENGDGDVEESREPQSKKKKKKTRNNKSAAPLVPSVFSQMKNETSDSESDNEDGDATRYTAGSQSHLPRSTINPVGLAKLRALQAADNMSNFDFAYETPNPESYVDSSSDPILEKGSQEFPDQKPIESMSEVEIKIENVENNNARTKILDGSETNVPSVLTSEDMPLAINGTAEHRTST